MPEQIDNLFKFEDEDARYEADIIRINKKLCYYNKDFINVLEVNLRNELKLAELPFADLLLKCRGEAGYEFDIYNVVQMKALAKENAIDFNEEEIIIMLSSFVTDLGLNHSSSIEAASRALRVKKASSSTVEEREQPGSELAADKNNHSEIEAYTDRKRKAAGDE